MKLSVIIPALDDEKPLGMILPHLMDEMPADESEIIIIDNGSWNELKMDHPLIKIIRNRRNVGVGMAFNQGVETAQSENIVLMGADVIPNEGWYSRVLETLAYNWNVIFNCVSTGFTDGRDPFHKGRLFRYGAKMLYKVTKDDLPSTSPLQNDPKFSRILTAKWNDLEPDPGETFGIIECLLGAFYWMKKRDYQRLHGWNGHRMWGNLEPMLSVKARAHGMQLVVDKNLEAAHYYNRDVGFRRLDLWYYNMLFMAHTMFSEALRDELVWYLRYGDRDELIEKYQVNLARKMIKADHGLVQAERDYNNRHFQHGLIANWERFQKQGV